MGDNGATTFGAGATGGLDKGKGKESENPQFADVSMGEEDDSSSDESAAEEQVDGKILHWRFCIFTGRIHKIGTFHRNTRRLICLLNLSNFANQSPHAQPYTEDDEAAQDDLNEISEENIINSGRRTRGKVINFAEAAAKAQEAGEDLDDDDDDEDFRGQDNDGDDEMKD
ncbi:hypothetical protein FQN51_001192 [Onygenales sp. PD_10]|nr:hypothetical protein FQN51_001192 [Onygenales sp. PD_10]